MNKILKKKKKKLLFKLFIILELNAWLGYDLFLFSF